ncbi:hypothetical protein [Magnetospirillum gryphiswaldense]|nr:hypothetical protein [Magnetospirillum gryphiswaldense]
MNQIESLVAADEPLKFLTPDRAANRAFLFLKYGTVRSERFFCLLSEDALDSYGMGQWPDPFDDDALTLPRQQDSDSPVVAVATAHIQWIPQDYCADDVTTQLRSTIDTCGQAYFELLMNDELRRTILICTPASRMTCFDRLSGDLFDLTYSLKSEPQRQAYRHALAQDNLQKAMFDMAPLVAEAIGSIMETMTSKQPDASEARHKAHSVFATLEG